MVRKSLALHKLILAAALTFVGSSSFGQVNIDLSTASVALSGSSNINISNISYNGAKYDLTLQWNPYNTRFDIASGAQSSGSAKKCSLGVLNTNGFTNTSVTITADPASRTFTIAYTPSSTWVGYGNTLDGAFNLSIIQNNAQLYLTTTSSSVNSNTAYFAEGPDPITGGTVDWTNVPAGSTRYATVTKVPTWYNFSLPISSVFESRWSHSYSCL